MSINPKLRRCTSDIYENRYFLVNLTTSGRVFLTEMAKRHIYGPRPFIWAYNKVTMTFRSKVLARTNSSLENRYFWLFWPILQLFLTYMVKLIYGPRPFIWAYNQVSMTLRSKVLACTKKYDGQTDGHPKPIGPQPKQNDKGFIHNCCGHSTVNISKNIPNCLTLGPP